MTLRELLYDFGGGSLSGRPIRAVQVGGPLGAYHPDSQFDTPLDYEAFAAIKGMLGHGGIVAFDEIVSVLFTTTPDLTATFPAEAARELGMIQPSERPYIIQGLPSH